MADAEAYAAVVVADVIGDRAQAVVARIAAAKFHPDFRRRQFDLVVKHHDAAGIELVEICSLRHRPARLVHVCAGQKQ